MIKFCNVQFAGGVDGGAVEWLEPLLPGRAGTADDGKFVNAVVGVLRSGMRWGDLPERYGL